MDTTVTQATAVAAGYKQNVLYLRGVAAISVVLFHASFFLDAVANDGRFLSVFPSRFGIFGVEIFFAISGYLMAVAAQREEMASSKFIVRRVARIYPVYFLSVLAAWAAFSTAGATFHFSALSLFLPPIGSMQYSLGIEWTLVFEMTFYVFLTVLIFAGLRRFIPLIAAIWLTVLGVTFAIGDPPVHLLVKLHELPITLYCVAFAGGLLIPTLLSRGFNPLWLLPAAFFVLPIGGIDVQAQRVLYGFSATTIVASAVFLPSLLPKTGLEDLLGKLGDGSYVLYLIHVPTIRLIYNYGRDVIPSPFLWMVGVAVPALLSMWAGRFDVYLHEVVMRKALKRMPKIYERIFAVLFVSAFIATAVWAEFN